MFKLFFELRGEVNKKR